MLKVALAAVLVVCVGGLIWAGGVFAYFGFLSGTSYTNRTTDTAQTRTLSFRSKPIQAESNADTRVRTWRLNMPKAYIGRELGANWAGDYYVNLDMLLNVETLQLAPRVARERPPAGFMEFRIALSNKPFLTRGPTGSCLDEQDLDNGRPEKLRRTPNGVPTVRGCNTLLCPLYLSYKGWRVEALVTKGQYTEKAKYCALTDRLMTQWTDRIESLAE